MTARAVAIVVWISWSCMYSPRLSNQSRKVLSFAHQSMQQILDVAPAICDEECKPEELVEPVLFVSLGHYYYHQKIHLQQGSRCTRVFYFCGHKKTKMSAYWDSESKEVCSDELSSVEEDELSSEVGSESPFWWSISR